MDRTKLDFFFFLCTTLYLRSLKIVPPSLPLSSSPSYSGINSLLSLPLQILVDEVVRTRLISGFQYSRCILIEIQLDHSNGSYDH